MSESPSPPSSEEDPWLRHFVTTIEKHFGEGAVVMSDTAAPKRTIRDLCVQVGKIGRMKRIPTNIHHRHLAALLTRRLIEWVEVRKPAKNSPLPDLTGSYYQLTELGRRAAAGEGKTDVGQASGPDAGGGDGTPPAGSGGAPAVAPQTTVDRLRRGDL